MDSLQKYKDSGILELYVYGLLSVEQSREVSEMLQQHPELLKEVEEIERAVMRLSADYYPKDTAGLRPILKQKDQFRNYKIYSWVASIAALFLIVFSSILFYQNRQLENSITDLNEENRVLEQQIISARNDLDKTRTLLVDLRSRDIKRVKLEPQQVAPQAYAVGYISSEKNQLILDAKELPEPPEGMVYQVWSLQFDPLTPISMGLLEDFAANAEKIFYLNARSESEGFGITLEPAGGSAVPNLDQLYVLGAIES